MQPEARVFVLFSASSYAIMKKIIMGAYVMENQSYSFRSAIHGFHRGDVINFLEKLSISHEAELRARDEKLRVLREELAEAREKLDARAAAPIADAGDPAPTADDELEAYRRAERHEREAKARAEKLCADASGAVQGVREQMEDRQTTLSEASDALQADFTALQALVSEILGEMNDANDRLGRLSRGLGAEE